MIRYVRSGTWSLLALSALAFEPVTAEAGWLGVRNDTNMAVVVQVSHVVNNVPRHGRPHLLYQNNITWERIVQPGNKIITLYDPNMPKRVLFQGTFPFVGADQFFSIQVEVPAAPGAALPGPPKLKLVPAKAPMQPPGP